MAVARKQPASNPGTSRLRLVGERTGRATQRKLPLGWYPVLVAPEPDPHEATLDADTLRALADAGLGLRVSIEGGMVRFFAAD